MLNMLTSQTREMILVGITLAGVASMTVGEEVIDLDISSYRSAIDLLEDLEKASSTSKVKLKFTTGDSNSFTVISDAAVDGLEIDSVTVHLASDGLEINGTRGDMEELSEILRRFDAAAEIIDAQPCCMISWAEDVTTEAVVSLLSGIRSASERITLHPKSGK